MAGRGRGRGRGLGFSTPKPVIPGGGDDPDAKVEVKLEETVRTWFSKRTVPKQEEVSGCSRGRGVTVSNGGPLVKQPVPASDHRQTQALSDFKSETRTALNDRGGDFAEEDFERLEQLFTLVGNVQDVAKAVYDLVKENQANGKGCAVLCERLSAIEAGGREFRSTILRLVQEDYKERERLKVKSNDEFLSCLVMLSHLLVHMRLANGEVMQPLISPLFDCLELIMKGDSIKDSEGDTVHDVLILIGRELQDNADERLQDLMLDVRGKIINQNTSPLVRGHLLEILETYARRWQVAPNEVTRFYLESNAEICAGLAIDGGS